MIETYQDLPKATNKEVVAFLREQIFVVINKAKVNYKVIVACFNTILKEVEKRLGDDE